MNLPASVFRGHLSLCSSLSSYPWCHLHYGPCAEVAYRGRYYRRSTPRILNPYSRSTFLWRRRIECWASMETGPKNQDDKEKGAEVEMHSSTSIKGEEKENENGASHSPPTVEQNNVPTTRTEFTSSSGMVDRNSGDDMLQGNDKEKYDPGEVASGSPLPGMKKIGEPIRIPKETIDIFRDQIFGFDTFFVTSQEPYESGVLFKGNLRGKASKSYDKITKRLKDRFGDQYKVFLLINPEDDKPVAVVVPRQIMQPESTAVPELFAAGAFGLVTVFTLLLRNVPALQANLLSVFDNVGLLKDGLSGALVTALILGVHEAGHFLVARDIGVKLGVPYLVPSWQTGSFGAITRILNIVPNREKLLKLAVAGPLAGFSLGIVLLLTGLILPPTDGIGIIIDPAIFHESFLIGGIAKLLLGDVLKEGTQLSINPLVLWAWTGLLINGINSIPAGELDGGRISFALWGRKVSTRISSVALALLGISSLFNDVAFYWVVLIFFLQRGPVAPLSEEITDPDDKNVALGIAVLLLCLLVLLPYPFPFTAQELVVDF